MKRINVPLPEGFEPVPEEQVAVFRLKEMNRTLIVKRDGGTPESRLMYRQECEALHDFVQLHMHRKTIAVRVVARKRSGPAPDDWAYYVVHGDEQIKGFKVSAACLNDLHVVVEEKRRYNPIPASMVPQSVRPAVAASA